jgi:hypothetical protein
MDIRMVLQVVLGDVPLRRPEENDRDGGENCFDDVCVRRSRGADGACGCCCCGCGCGRGRGHHYGYDYVYVRGHHAGCCDCCYVREHR